MSEERLGGPPEQESPEDRRGKIGGKIVGVGSEVLAHRDNEQRVKDAIRKLRQLATDLEKTLE